MKATVVKNNNFETIGFEVIASGRTLFSWGISSTSKSNFQKEINVNDWMTEIFELVRIQTSIEEKSKFFNNFFEVACSQGFVKDGQPVNFKRQKEEIERLKEKLNNIVKNII